MENDTDCSNFVLIDEKSKRKLIPEDSPEYKNFVELEEVDSLVEEAVVFLKVNNYHNQVFVMNGVDKTDIVDLTIIVKTDNAKSSDNHFVSILIDNGDETICISEKTSWRVKGRYIPGVLNVESSSQFELGNSNEGTLKPC